MAGTIKWDARLLTRYIDDLPHKAAKLAERQAKLLAERTTAHIVGVGAVDTGRLRDSPVAEPYGSMAWRVRVPVDYAGFVNYGTYKMAARPFWEPAIEDTRAAFDEAGRTELRP